MIDRNFNHEVEAHHAVTRAIVAAARDANSPAVGAGYGLAGSGEGSTTPRSFEDGSGGTISQMYTELDSTEEGDYSC